MSDQEPPSPWLLPLLAVGRPSSRFREACRREAEQAAALCQLRLARQQLPPDPVGVRAYLTRLAHFADVPLQAVTAWAGLALDQPLGQAFAAAWGRLASALRLGWRETRLQLWLSAAEQGGAPLFSPLLAAGRSLNAPALPEEVILTEGENRVATALAGWDETRLAQLRAWEEAARQGFATASDGTGVVQRAVHDTV